MASIIANLDPKSLLALSAGSLASFVVFYYIQLARKDRKIRSLGSRAHILYSSPISGVPMILKAGMAASKHNLKAFYEELYGDKTVLEAQMSYNLRTIITREPEHVKAMLATDFASFGKGERFHKSTSPFLGDGIFSTDGNLWSDARRMIRPFFVTERVRDLEIFERGIQKMLSKLPKTGETVDIFSFCSRLTVDAITDYLLGESIDSLDDPDNKFMKAFDTVQQEQMYILMVTPFENLVPRGTYNASLKQIEAFITPYIHKTLSLPQSELEELSKSDRDFTFLHGLALYTRDPKTIRDQILNVLLAGRDTTAATLAWSLYELSAYPEKYTRLRAEVLDVVGRHKAPTYQNLKDMKYLRYTLQEILRLYPAVPVNMKIALKDTTLPATPNSPAIGVCKGDTIAWQAMMVQLRSDLYPAPSEKFADPAVFSPERWEVWQPKPFEYVPFNGGPRVCIGQNFANTELGYCLVRILQKYKSIEYRGDWSAQLRSADLVARPHFGVPVGMYEAADDE